MKKKKKRKKRRKKKKKEKRKKKKKKVIKKSWKKKGGSKKKTPKEKKKGGKKKKGKESRHNSGQPCGTDGTGTCLTAVHRCDSRRENRAESSGRMAVSHRFPAVTGTREK